MTPLLLGSIVDSVGSGEVFAAGGVLAAVMLAVVRAFYGEAPIHRSVKVLEAHRAEAERQERAAKDLADRWRGHALIHEQAAWRWEQRARVWHRRAMDHGWQPNTDDVTEPHPDEREE